MAALDLDIATSVEECWVTLENLKQFRTVFKSISVGFFNSYRIQVLIILFKKAGVVAGDSL